MKLDIYFRRALHTIEQILENQSLFKDEIIKFLREDLSDSMSILRKISTDDELVKNALKSFRNKIKKMNRPPISHLFILHKKNKEFYAWWDISSGEAIIYKHDKTK